MAVLVAFLVVGVAVLATVGYLKAARRDARSVESYHTVMEHLEHLNVVQPGSGRAAQPHVRIVPGTPIEPARNLLAEGDPATERSDANRPAPEPVAVTPALPEPHSPARTPMVFVDEPLVSGVPLSAATPIRSASGTPMTPRERFMARIGLVLRVLVAGRAISRLFAVSASRRASRLRLKARVMPMKPLRWAAATVLAGLVAMTVLLALPGGAHQRRPQAEHASAPIGATPGGSVSRLPSPPPTTPPPIGVTLVSTNPSAAEYAVTSEPVDLSLVATGRCWIELRSGSVGGPIVFEGILTSGDHQSFDALPGLWLRLGYPAGVRLQIDATAVSLPSTAGPYDVTVHGTPSATT